MNILMDQCLQTILQTTFRKLSFARVNPRSGSCKTETRVCARARAVFNELGYECFKIPPRSPDLNPIENLFHLVKKKLNDEAIERKILFENYQDFQDRVIDTLKNFDITIINNIISSMNKRIQNIIERKGQRLKY
jgi:hypothetical protein